MSPPAPPSDDEMGPQGREKATKQSTLSGRTKIGSVLALDEKIRETRLVIANLERTRNSLSHAPSSYSGPMRTLEEFEALLGVGGQIEERQKVIVDLKRTRNSLSNISKLPPEVLGNIFCRNVCFNDEFDGLEDGSHNFLFVCHHWYEVALGTPELWSFWGNVSTGETKIGSVLALDEQIREREVGIASLKRTLNSLVKRPERPNDDQASKPPRHVTELSLDLVCGMIRERQRVIADLKRTRNSLSNVSKLPPEVLGNIFCWNVCFKGDFDGLEERSHNFLLVCHRWHEVALGTPELWSFWGNTTADWARWSRRSGTAPLDLVLSERDFDSGFDDGDSDDRDSNDGHSDDGGSDSDSDNGDPYAGHSDDSDSDNDPLDATLSKVLRDRAARDTIRRIHLRSGDPELLRSVISQLTPKEDRFTNVESFVLHDERADPRVDISDFLARHHFPKLRNLEHFNCTISSWDLLKSRTPVLTILDICFGGHPSTPTTPELLSVLASCPTLQKVALLWSDDLDGGGEVRSPRASLHHLKELKLHAPANDVFWLLDRLDHPRIMDRLNIALTRCILYDVSHVVGPYLLEYLQRRGRSQNGLGLSLEPDNGDSKDVMVLRVGDMDELDFFAPARPQMNQFMAISIAPGQTPNLCSSRGAMRRLIAHVPRERVVYFRTYNRFLGMKDIHTLLPDLKGLHFNRTPWWNALPTRKSLDPGGDGEILPSLQCLLIDGIFFGCDIGSCTDNWNPLITFLDRRMSSGNQLHTLVTFGCKSPPRRHLKRAVKIYANIRS